MRLDAGLVLGVIGAGRVDQDAVVAGQLGVRPVDLRVIQVRLEHPGLQVVRHDPGRDTAEELERLHVRLDPRPLVHPDHRPDEQVPGVAQHHRERPHPPAPPRARIEPRAQVAVIHLRLGAGRRRRPPDLQLRLPRPLRELRPHVPADAGHARRQALLITQPLPDHRHRHHAQQLADPVMMTRDLRPRPLPRRDAGQLGEPLPRHHPPPLRADRRAARRQPRRLRSGHVLADRLDIHAKTAGHLHLRPARVPVLQNLRHVDHRERPPRHLALRPSADEEQPQLRRTRRGTPSHARMQG